MSLSEGLDATLFEIRISDKNNLGQRKSFVPCSSEKCRSRASPASSDNVPTSLAVGPKCYQDFRDAHLRIRRLTYESGVLVLFSQQAVRPSNPMQCLQLAQTLVFLHGSPNSKSEIALPFIAY